MGGLGRLKATLHSDQCNGDMADSQEIGHVEFAVGEELVLLKCVWRSVGKMVMPSHHCRAM